MTRSKLSLLLISSLFAAGAYAGEASQAELQSQAKVSEADARVTALAKVPVGSTISSAELEKEHGKLVWSFDIAQAKSKNVTEVQVDAVTGNIVSTKTETPRQEAKEAAAEKKEGK
jgi:uncharacterized membrane protein YkoI